MKNRLKSDIRFSITNCLIAIYVVVFLVSLVYGQDKIIFNFGLNVIEVIGGHQYWRIFTNEFVHAGIWHVFMNSYFIYIIGSGIEDMLGKGRYLFLVIATILSSSGAVLLWDWQTKAFYNMTVGASGFGYGLIGLLAGFAILYPKRYYGKYLMNLLMNVVLYSVLFSFGGVNLSWAGHIGGFLGGLIVALILNVFFPKKEW